MKKFYREIDEIEEFSKNTSPKKMYSMDELAQLFHPEDPYFIAAAYQYQTVLNESKGDFNFIVEKYVFYKNMYIEEEWNWHGEPNSKLDYLRDLCEFLEGRIVLMTLANIGYRRNFDDKHMRWKKV